MKKLLVGVLLILSLLIWFYFFRTVDFEKLRGNQRFNVLMITLDTTRADHLGCYGYKKIRTPNIDDLAQKGILFERCITPTPLTLPAHTSIFTGTYPLYHGVRDNAAFIVPQELTTIAEIFKKNQYQTGAFVSSFVLDSKWGLDQGFDEYFDDFTLNQENIVSIGDIQRPGNLTVDAALKWLSKVQDRPFFLWVHLYDPHSPYDPPDEYKKLFPDNPYDGEIAFADAQIGRLLQFLRTNDLRNRTFVFFAADHGESLGEHQEEGHGFFVYQETLHVPFIISTPFSKYQNKRKREVVSLIDIFPTMTKMCGFSALPVQGQNLIDTQETRSDRFVYAETFYPRFHFGWSELQSIQNETNKFILSSDSELFDLKQDPEEMQNLQKKDLHKTSAYESKARLLIAESSRGAKSQNYSQLDEETQEKLAALGYIGTFSNLKQKARLPAPREKIRIYAQLSEARELSLSSDFQRAESLLREIIQKDPEIIDAYSTLGNIYLKQNRLEDAIRYYQKALELKPDDAALITGIAACESKLGNHDAAEKLLLDSLKILPSDSRIYFVLGNVYRAMKKEDQAIDAYNRCLRLNPKSASAYNALAAIYFLRKDFPSARRNIEAALKIDEQLPGVHYTQAQMLENEGKLQDAIHEYQQELVISPKNFKAAYNLSTIYRQLGNVHEEEYYLRKSIELNSEFPLSYLYLARIQLKSGQNYNEAIQLVNQSLENKLEPKHMALAYFLLADLYNRTGNQKLSQEYAEKGKAIRY